MTEVAPGSGFGQMERIAAGAEPLPIRKIHWPIDSLRHLESHVSAYRSELMEAAELECDGDAVEVFHIDAVAERRKAAQVVPSISLSVMPRVTAAEESQASDWQDDDNPKAETTDGVC